MAIDVPTRKDARDRPSTGPRTTARAPARDDRTRRRGDGKARILQSALELFVDHGFDAVSTTDIAQRADSSQSVVMYHFSTKEELWREAMRYLFDTVMASPRFEDGMYKDLDPLSRLRVLLRRFVHVSARHPELGRVINREASSGSDRLTWLIEELARPTYTVFQVLFADCVERGLIKDYPPVMLTLMVHGAGATIFNLAGVHRILAGGDPFTPELVERQADLLVDAVLSGLRP